MQNKNSKLFQAELFINLLPHNNYFKKINILNIFSWYVLKINIKNILLITNKQSAKYILVCK